MKKLDDLLSDQRRVAATILALDMRDPHAIATVAVAGRRLAEITRELDEAIHEGEGLPAEWADGATVAKFLEVAGSGSVLDPDKVSRR